MAEKEKKQAVAPQPEKHEPGVRGEQVVMGDGQLGGKNIERGPERRNPEGTALTPNPPPDQR